MKTKGRVKGRMLHTFGISAMPFDLAEGTQGWSRASLVRPLSLAECSAILDPWLGL